MTLVSCHCEAERSEAVAIAKCLELNEITTSCATPRNDKYVSEAHSKELNVLTSYRLNDFKKKAAFTLAEGATHVDMSDNIRRAAFTLAEVLITLGIIGVVAAMTIPTLIANYQKKQTVSKLKQTYSIISQALTMAQAEHGDTTTWDVAGIYGTPTNDPNFNSRETLAKFVTKYFIPYLKVSKDYGITTASSIKYDGFKLPPTGEYFTGWGSYKYYMLLSNNVLITVSIGTSGCAEGTSVADGTCVETYVHLIFYGDMNGFSGPNTFGKDVFVMRFNLRSRVFEFYQYGSSKESALRNCESGGGITCGQLIYLDGWEIKDDYPW